MNHKYLSIDSGGTKTLGRIYDIEGNILKELTVGPANFAVSFENAKKVIVSLIQTLLDHESVDIIILGLAGSSRIKNMADFEQELSDQFGVVVKAYPDAYLGLYAHYQNELPLLYVVSGTGSIVYAIKDEHVFRFGGYGHIFGDDGSAYGISIAFLKDILNRFDQQKGFNPIQKKILKSLKLKTRESIIGFAHEVGKEKIASIAKHLDLYHDTTYVQKLYKKQAQIIFKHLQSIVKTLKITDTFQLIFKGGFIENAHGIQSQLIGLLNQSKLKYKLEEGTNEPVYGGYILGRSYIRRDG